ncbi:MAG TPA: hypothetical protein VII45_04375, partial [Solirubrobacterales bacterium]
MKRALIVVGIVGACAIGAVSSFGASGAARLEGPVARPHMTSSLIPFGPKRKREMAAYSERHYGEHTWRLKHPKVIVEHMAEIGTVSGVFNTFAPDVPDVELHELPNV